MRLLALILFISLLHNSSWAADAKGRFAVRNAGMVDCATFVAEKKKRSSKFSLYMGWIDGYISAANQFTPDTFDLIPWGNTVFLATLLENHCAKNPEQPFYVAVNKLAAAMMPQRLQSHSEMVETKYKGKKTYIYKAVLLEVQKYLKKEKLYNGKADGSFGLETRRALEKFQQKKGLAVTGLPDQLTLYSLYREIKKS